MEIKDIAPLATAAVALYVASTWRAQTTGKRKIEVAEQTLMLFYEARDAIGHIRHPMSWGGEESASERSSRESEDQFKARKQASVAFTRHKQYSELFGKVHAARYQFHTLFGITNPDPFMELNKLVNEILIAARMLSHLWAQQVSSYAAGGKAWESHHAQVERYEAVFWQGAEDDPFTKRVNGVIEQVEALCRPILSPPSFMVRTRNVLSHVRATLTKIG